MTNKTKGFVFGAVSAASYGMNPLFALPLYKEGLSVDNVLLMRYTVAATIMGLLMIKGGESFKVRKSEIMPLVVMGVLYAVSSLFLFKGYKVMDAGVAATIFFAYPVMVALINGAFFHEHISRMVWGCMLTALGGIALLGQTAGGGTLSISGTIFVLLSALAYVIYMIGVKESRLKTMSSSKLNFYALSLGAFIFLFRVHPLEGGIALPDSAFGWTMLAGLALVPTVLSLLTLTRSIRYIGSTLTAVLGAFEPITALFFGVVLFGEQLTPRNMLGIVLVISSVMAIVCEKQIQHLLKGHLA